MPLSRRHKKTKRLKKKFNKTRRLRGGVDTRNYESRTYESPLYTLGRADEEEVYDNERWTIFTDFDQTLTEDHSMFYYPIAGLNNNEKVISDLYVNKNKRNLQMFMKNILNTNYANQLAIKTFVENMRTMKADVIIVTSSSNTYITENREIILGIANDSFQDDQILGFDYTIKPRPTVNDHAVQKSYHIANYLYNLNNNASQERSIFIDDSMINCNMVKKYFPKMIVIQAIKQSKNYYNYQINMNYVNDAMSNPKEYRNPDVLYINSQINT
jgi:predicted enzyme involved in methoxymalonyl-ACP biosynthesis